MSANRLILACAAVMAFGTWLAWRSISRVEASAETREPEDPAAIPETPGSSEPLLQSISEESHPSPTRAEAAHDDDARVPLLVSGIVVDDRNEPIRGAGVTILAESRGDERPVRLQGVGFSDGSGRFEVRRKEERVRLLASAVRQGYFEGEPVAFERGAADVKIVLVRAGVVAGRIVLDPGIPMDALKIQLRDPDLPGSRRLVDSAWRDGEFSFDHLRNSSATLSVHLDSMKSPLLEVESIRVRKIGEARDPRLDPLDLRGTLEQVTIEVQDDAGKKCSWARVVLSDPTGRFEDRSGVTQDGTLTVLAPRTPYDVDVDLDGWRRAHLDGTLGSQLVRLRRGIPVRVILDGSDELPPAPYRLAIALFADVRPPRSGDDGMGTFAVGRGATFLSSLPGRHEVGWYIDGGRRQSYLTGIPRTTVQLRDEDDEQVIHLELTRAVRSAWEEKIRRELNSEPDSLEFREASPRPRVSATAEPRPR